jgi:hypothetical protein
MGPKAPQPLTYGLGQADQQKTPLLLPCRCPCSRAIPALYPTTASHHDQGLAQLMSVPGSPGTRLKCHAGAEHAGRSGRIEQGVDSHSAGGIFGGSLGGRL